MKKIVFVTTIPESLGIFKGQLHFLKSYFDVYAISSNKEKLNAVAEKEGINIIEIPMVRLISIFKDIRGLIRFITVFMKLRPDIVHGNTPKGGLLSMLAAFIVGVPNRIYMCHGLRYQGYSGIMRKLLIFMEYITCTCATKVLCVSDGVLQTLKADNICVNKARIVLSGSANGIDLEYYKRDNIKVSNDFYQKYNLSSQDFIYCFIGRIVKDKGVNELLEAFNFLCKKHGDIRLLIVGTQEGNLNPISEVSNDILLNNPNIRFVGIQGDVRPFLAISDTLVLPSYREGFGIVLMEAAAMGVPSIASNIIGCNNVVIEGENGLFCNSKDVSSLLEVMEKVYLDTDIRIHIKSVTRQSIADRFEQKKVWEALLKEYQS